MHDPSAFRRQLSLRLLGALGAASLVACTGGGGTGSAGASSTGAGAGATHASASTATSASAGTGGAGMHDAGAGSGGSAGQGTGGAGGQSGSGGAGVGGVPAAHECFDWPPDGGYPLADDGGDEGGAMLLYDAGPPTSDCPSVNQLVIYEISTVTCAGGTGWDPYKVLGGPTRNAQNQCCYSVVLKLCVNGGRPYLDDEGARLSALAPGDAGWADGASPNVDGLSPAQRAALARAWAEDGLREHASVASFARFSLELLALGAPAALVERAHRAALDEIRHASLCFALASAYAGETLGPGPFPVGGEVRVAGTLADLAASTVREGCVGETVAAVLASEQLARATDPAVRAALARIAEDEARHAELAWRTVAWAVRAGGDAVRAAVACAFESSLGLRPRSSRTVCQGAADRLRRPASTWHPQFEEAAAAIAAGGAPGEDACEEAHGRIGASSAARIAELAIAEVVAPAARAVLARATLPRVAVA